MPETPIDPSHWSPRLEPRNYEICRLYVTGKYTTEAIAKRFKLDRRQVQRVVQQGGVGRSQADGNRVASKLRRPFYLLRQP